MYRNFLIVIFEYIKNLKLNIIIYEIITPLLISGMLFYFNHVCLNIFLNSSMTFMSILVGFTIASIAILLTSNSKSIAESREFEIDKKDFLGNVMTIYRLLLLNLFYCVLVGFFILIFGAISLVFQLESKIVFAINLFLSIHILLVVIRNLVNLFLIAYKKS